MTDIDPDTTRLREETEDGGYMMTVWMDKDENVIPYKDWPEKAANGRRLTYDAEGVMVLSEALIADEDDPENPHIIVDEDPE